jgi:hypothetical protein
LAKSLPRDSHEPHILSRSRDGWKSHRVAHPGSASRQIRRAEFVEQSVNFLRLQDSRNDREPLFLDRLQPTERLSPSKGFNIFSCGRRFFLVLRGAVGVDGGADDSHFVGGGDEFEAAAL